MNFNEEDAKEKYWERIAQQSFNRIVVQNQEIERLKKNISLQLKTIKMNEEMIAFLQEQGL